MDVFFLFWKREFVSDSHSETRNDQVLYVAWCVMPHKTNNAEIHNLILVAPLEFGGPLWGWALHLGPRRDSNLVWGKPYQHSGDKSSDGSDDYDNGNYDDKHYDNDGNFGTSSKLCSNHLSKLLSHK